MENFTLEDSKAIASRDALVKSLRQHGPRGSMCIFLNCELHQTAGGLTVSGDLFSVITPLFGKPRRVQRKLIIEELEILEELAPYLFKETSPDHVIFDLLIDSNDQVKTFLDFSPLRRIGGDDDFFKSKHKSYISVEKLLGEID